MQSAKLMGRISGMTTSSVPVRWALVLSIAAGSAWAARPGDDVCGHDHGSFTQGESALNKRVNHAPARVVDTTHMKLDLVIRDMNVPSLQGTAYHTLTPVNEAVSTFTLDARAMTVTSMSMEGHSVSFEHDGRVLTITLDPPLATGKTAELVTTYEVKEPPTGLVWTPEASAWPGRPAQLHTQGQPESNSYWFPCRDFPDEKTTTELIVTAPEGFIVSANGKLASRVRTVLSLEEDAGVSEQEEGAATTVETTLGAYEQWHWVQDTPHSNYLVSLVVGKFDVVDVGGAESVKPQLWMPVYVPEGRGKDVAATYGRTAEMIRVFENATAQEYPWARYAQLVVSNFASGGMENTSATTMHDNAILSPAALLDSDLEGLISHELGHQWFGDLLTCASWEHIWLNEGFATFMTGLWVENRATPPASAPWMPTGREAYLLYFRGNFDGVIEKDTGKLPEKVGFVSNVYDSTWEPFRRDANPYGKGSSVLHMLRSAMGDAAFFKALRSYVAKYKYQNVETDQFRQECEAASGLSLEQFFNQWTRRPNIPRLAITSEWKSDTGTLDVTMEQTQPIDGDNPAFEFSMPVRVERKGAPASVSLVKAEGKKTTVSIPCPTEPVMVAFDPELTVLAELKISQPVAWSYAQLANGPTQVSRIQAARTLRGDASLRTTETLRRLAVSRKDPVAVRLEAIKSLAERGSDLDMRTLYSTAADTWELRRETVEGLIKLATNEKREDLDTLKPAVAEMLATRAKNDASVLVRAACVRGLGKLKAGEYATIIMDALNTDSQSDELRLAGLDALGEMKPADGLVLAMTYAAEGNGARTRPAAIDAVRKLSKQNPDEAFKLLVTLLDDRELRTRRAAAEQLVKLNDPRGVAALQAAEQGETWAKDSEWKLFLSQRSKELQDALAGTSGK